MNGNATPRPCDFCGKTTHLNAGRDRIDGEDRWQVWCNYCGCAGPHEATEAEALTAWDTRARDSAVNAMKEALEAVQFQASNHSGWVENDAWQGVCEIHRLATAALTLSNEEISDG